MTVCYFGIYTKKYSRNRILIHGLKQNRIKVIECHTSLRGLKKYLDLIHQHQKIKMAYDVMIVGYPGYEAFSIMLLAKLLTRKKIILDIFISFYNTFVEDLQSVKKKSLKAIYYWFKDYLACRLADKVILDTNSHIQYFVHKFKLPLNKFIRLFVGADNQIIFPLGKNYKFKNQINRKFSVIFIGGFLPLHGIKYIIQAADILKTVDIKFILIGQGHTYSQIIKLVNNLQLKNIEFIDKIAYEEIRNYNAQADICLGIFGKTIKANQVIPNKIYEALACKKPIITADTFAVRELLTDRKNVLLTKIGDAHDLAKKILILKDNLLLKETIAENGFKLFNKQLTPEKLGRELKNIIQLL